MVFTGTQKLDNSECLAKHHNDLLCEACGHAPAPPPARVEFAEVFPSPAKDTQEKNMKKNSEAKVLTGTKIC